MDCAAKNALEMIRSRANAASIYHRIGEAITHVIASDVSAIEVFDRNGDYAERRWSNSDSQISQNFESFLANRFSHPLFKEFVISGLRSPVRISDCIDDRGFRATGMFNEFFRPLRISTQMAVALPSDSVGVAVLALARSRVDYTLKEKSLLNELMPKIRSEIAAEQTLGHFDLLIRQLLGAEAAVALIIFHEYVVQASSQVFDLLDDYFPDHVGNRGQLPRPLAQLLRSRGGTLCSTHTFRSPKKLQSSLVITVCDSENGDQQVLSFKEIESPRSKLTKRFDLSPRLIDVLLLIEEGCSNKQIAERLAISPNTIRTQVEKLLHRMNVANRTQAATLARRCLDEN
jgi:DNA-binding CsgD family transcriptional regulator